MATKAEAHRLLERLAAEEGVGGPNDFVGAPQVLRMGNRTLVMREGRLAAEFSHSEVSEERIVAAATGQHQEVSSLGTTNAVGIQGRHDHTIARRRFSRLVAEMSTQDAARAGGGSPQRLVDMVFRLREYGIIVVLIVFIAVTTGIQPRFLGQQNIKFVLLNATIYALLALGETMVVVSRQMDLSVGSVLGLSAYVSSNLFGQVHGIPIPVVFLVGIGIGLVCGIVTAP